MSINVLRKSYKLKSKHINNKYRYKIIKTDKSLHYLILYIKRSNIMIRVLLSRKLGELRWTQADLARKTGIRPNTINDLYHEMADRVSLEQIDLICEALNCDLSELLVCVPNSVSELNSRNRLGELKKDT